MKRTFVFLTGLFFVLTSFAGVLHLRIGDVNTSASNEAGVMKLKARSHNDFYIAEYPANEPRLYIVQFKTPITTEIKQALEERGIKIFDYIPDNAFIVWANKGQMDSLNLASLDYKGIFQPAFRVQPALIPLAKSDSLVEVRITFYPVISKKEAEFALMDAGAVLEKADSSSWQHAVIAKVSSRILPHIASLPGVKWVEKYVAPKPYSVESPHIEFYVDKKALERAKNHQASDIMNVAPVWDAGYTGSTQIAAVCDTGLDVGDYDSIHRDFFQDLDGDGHNDKIVAAYALGRTNDWSDDQGHGTHTAGSVLGNGAKSNGQFKGMAYNARLVEQSVLDSRGGLGGLPADLNDLFQQAYDDGARVHSNSWGAAVSGQYDSSSQQVDQFTWNHKDMVITVSAGNEGVDSDRDGVIDLDSIGSPATAKNCITVGATESDINATTYTWGQGWPDSYPADPINSDNLNDNRNGMAAFSSRGPCDDGRIKPDIVAPGTMIISVRSQDPNADTGWGAYDDWYIYEGGTSMSNPLTAGSAVLAREFFEQHEGITPSSALIKATLMNGAYDIYPGQYGTGAGQEIPTKRPNNVEGWGRVDLANALMPQAPVQLKYFDETSGLNTGDTKTYTVDVADTSVPLRITLVWTDYPASTSSSKQLVNDLDLTVTAPNGTVYYPNHLSGADRTNNVETVDIENPVSGTYTVTVKGYNVPYGPQPFAIAMHGGFGTSAPDTTPPVISNVQANPSYDSATITWTTDESASSVVVYGTSSSNLNQQATSSGYTTSHSVNITGLNAETTYYFKVKSADSSGNESQSDVYSFTTTAEPQMPTDFSDDMENGDGNWTKHPDGSTPWAIVSTSYVHSGSHALFSADEGSIKDDTIDTYEIDLRNASTATLTFYHTYELENTYDGAVIEISTDGGSTFTDLGSHITQGGYNGTISTSYQSPIAGRSAWTGGSLGTMTQVVVDLSSYVGNTVIIRFRMACDSSVNKTGWYVDDVVVSTSGSTPTPAPTVDSFTADPTTITEGESSTLSWQTTNATSVTIKDGNGSTVYSGSSVDGSTTVSPTSTTTYTLTATGDGGTATASVTVTVNSAPAPAPTVDSFTADPTTITEGESSTLSWQTTNATSVTIKDGNGNTVYDGSTVDGSTTVSPTSTTTYTLTATGDGGTATASVTVTVNPADNSGTVDTRTFSSTDVPKSIPDNDSNGVISTLEITDGTDIQSLTVHVDITHTYVGDLTLYLIGPDGTTVTLRQNSGGSADDIHEDYTPTEFNGKSAVGTWKLKVVDNATYDTGTIDGWSLTIKATYSSDSGGDDGGTTPTTHTYVSSDTPISIPDNNATGITSSINVPDSAVVTEIKVTVDITHTYIGDLIVTLVAPNGATATLSDREGGSDDDIHQTYTVTASDGIQINGTWKLKVSDNAQYDTGTLDGWKLEFTF
ncbi:hypothetical protein TTHT_0221 [Thermotomaculum hydrothermale]|uniref:Peptidase S8 and S53 subtilisin kexin sedolisin n=1 Tax=Thermotomaculum hydrothermale TaxID=981385 RepID=A0A7R6SYH0_9BACT|nr:proprotein convertase P-domain-containing protein [Thermotomaculum hydrothermale]BBB31845.1 hypothetical protein TTHT_0221 [Thermotomaculum hydrothermale]